MPMHRIPVFFLVLGVSLLSACRSGENTAQADERPGSEAPAATTPANAATDTGGFAGRVASAHKARAWADHEVLSYDLVLRFRGSERLRARIHYRTDGTALRIERQDGRVLWFNGDTLPDAQVAWTAARDEASSEAPAEWPSARFDALTWTYFQALPYKIADPGTRLERLPGESLNGRAQAVALLRFDAGIGDAPDDWYRLYADSVTGVLQAAAYVVTFSKSLDKAEEDPHAIVYSSYRAVDGVPLAHAWTFTTWREGPDGRGVFSDTLGSATLGGFGFRPAQAGEFQAPAAAQRVPAPDA